MKACSKKGFLRPDMIANYDIQGQGGCKLENAFGILFNMFRVFKEAMLLQGKELR